MRHTELDVDGAELYQKSPVHCRLLLTLLLML